MRAEYWAVAAFGLAIAEILLPGVFLIFFAGGALVAAAVALAADSLVVQLGVFVVATLAALLAGNSVYRRYVAGKNGGQLDLSPVGEPGMVEENIVNGRGKVRVRDISWLAAGPDLPKGTPIVVVASSGTLLNVAAVSPADRAPG